MSTATRPRIRIVRPFFADLIAPLRTEADVVVEAERARDSAELNTLLLDCDAAIVGLSDRIDAAVIAGNARIRLIANLGVGHNNLDLPALTRAGIAASNTPEVLNESVADYAFALLLAAARRLGQAERWLRAGQWQAPNRFDDWLGVEVHGATLGILGMGRIGQAIARRAAGFSMSVLYHNRSRLDTAREHACRARYVDKATLLRAADFLMLVLPYTEQNRHAIGASELALMKPGSVLVNIARGGIVDDAALAEALHARRIAAAALDVFEDEPAPHPRLLMLDNVVLSPHIASASTPTRRAMAQLALDNVRAVLGLAPGPPPSVLNPDVLDRAARKPQGPSDKSILDLSEGAESGTGPNSATS